MYAHIRATHQPDCLKITMTYPLYKTESGDIIDFEGKVNGTLSIIAQCLVYSAHKESCRDTLKPGDKILLETANSKGMYEICNRLVFDTNKSSIRSIILLSL